MACWTLDEIAESEGIGVKTADDAIAAETAGLPKPQQSLADHADEAVRDVLAKLADLPNTPKPDQALARRHN